MFKLYTLTIISLLLLSGCASKDLLENSAELKNITKKEKIKPKRDYRRFSYEYKVAPHDRVKISVYNHPELGTKIEDSNGVLVDSRGIISLPLVGNIKISGLTQPKAARKVQLSYSKYLKNTNIHLEVINKKAYVIGEVGTQGFISLDSDQIGLLQAIASKGGFKDTANKEKLIIIRKMKRHPKLEIVDLTNITSLSYTNMMIRADDIIYVPSTDVKVAGVRLSSLLNMLNTTLGIYVKINDINN